MSTRDGGPPWFVMRQMAARPRRGNIVPVTRAGYLTFVVFVLGEIVSVGLGMIVVVTMPDMLFLGIAIIAVGVVLSVSFLFLMIARHVDRSISLDDYRAQQVQRG